MTRPIETDTATQRVLVELEEHELLLQAGHEFASVANIVAEETIRGSWWAHPKSNLIYWVCEDLERDPRVTESRLIAGKVTHLWQSIWPHVTAVAHERARWQLDRLSAAALNLLARVDHAPVRTDSLTWSSPDQKLGDVCRLLERRLLVKAREVHTESGRHAKLLTSWHAWWAQQGSDALPAAESARAHLERLVGGKGRLLPWQSSNEHLQ